MNDEQKRRMREALERKQQPQRAERGKQDRGKVWQPKQQPQPKRRGKRGQ